VKRRKKDKDSRETLTIPNYINEDSFMRKDIHSKDYSDLKLYSSKNEENDDDEIEQHISSLSFT
jgi:hypothetical protein